MSGGSSRPAHTRGNPRSRRCSTAATLATASSTMAANAAIVLHREHHREVIPPAPARSYPEQVAGMPARIVRSHLGKPGEEMVRRKVQPFSGPIEENTYGTVPV